MSKKLKHMLFKYIVLFYAGFTSYITIECLFRGYSFPMMGFVGAIDFMIIDKVDDKVSWDIPLFFQGCIGSIIITLSELIVGTLDKSFWHIDMWDYSNMMFNFNGVICLEFSIIWIFISIYAIVVADFINYYLIREGTRPHYTILKHVVYFPKISN